MTTTDIQSLVQKEMVDKPIIDELGLNEEDFYGAVTAANEKLAAGNADGALQDFANLVLIAPRSVAFQMGLSDAATQAGQLELALQAASFVVSADPKRPEGFLLSGKACLAMGEKDLAREDFNDALTRAEMSPEHKNIAAMARRYLALTE